MPLFGQGLLPEILLNTSPLMAASDHPLSQGLDLIQFLEHQEQGQQAVLVLQELIKQPLQGDGANWLRLGESLLAHAFWSDVQRLAEALANSHPKIACWLRLNGALECGQLEQAATELQRLQQSPDETVGRSKLAEAHIRLATMQSREADSACLHDPAVQVAIKARYWLHRGQADVAASLLDHAPETMHPLILWQQATLAAHRGDRVTACSTWSKAIAMRPRLAGLRVDRGRFLLSWGDMKGGEDIEIALKLKPWAGGMVLPWVGILTERGDYARALKILDYSLSAHPDQPELVALLLDVLREKKDSVQALAVGEKAIQQFPRHGDVTLAWGNTLLLAGRRDAAITVYRQAMSLGKAGVARSNLAKLLFDEGDVDEAIALWWEALRETPDDTVIRINLAQALLQRGDMEEAQEQFGWINARFPKTAAALRGYAECAMALGDMDGAEKNAAAALELVPAETQCYLVLAAVRKMLGQDKIALSTLEAGLKRVTRPLPLQQAIWRLLIQRREYETALQRAAQAAQTHPETIEYRLMVVDTLYAQNRFELCRTILEEAKDLDRERASKALVRFLQSRDQWEEALAEARSLLAISPDAVRHYGLVAEVLYRMERYAEAETVLRDGVAREPARLSINQQLVGQLMAREDFGSAIQVARAYLDRGVGTPQYKLYLGVLERAYRRQEAYDVAETWLRNDPANLSAQIAVANTAERILELDRAREVLQQGLSLRPGNIGINTALIQLLLRDEAYSEALTQAQHLVQRFGEKPEAVMVAVTILVEADRMDEAKAALNKAIEQHSRHQKLWMALYRLYRRTENHEEAKALLAATTQRFPYAEDALGWVADECLRYGDIKEAERATKQWTARKPNEWAPLFKQLDIAEKRRAFGQVQTLAAELSRRWPDEPAILGRMARAYSECWQMNQAIRYARKALELRPDNIQFMDALAAYSAKSGIFSEFTELLERIKRQLGDKRYSYYNNWFFNINCHPDLTEAEIFEYYREWGDKTIARYLPPPRPLKNNRDPERKLRVGYLSPDFRRHAVAYFSEPLFIGHDHEESEVFAFAHIEPGTSDEYTERFKGYVDHWIDVTSLSDSELYRKVRDLEIDLLFDLAGHTSHNKLHVMARRMAPVQGSWIIGAGQTTGVPNVDVLIADQYLIPEASEIYCTERVVRLDMEGLCYRPPDGTPDVADSPCLHNGYLTFGSFSRPIRLNSYVIAVWARLLNRLPTARLRLDHVPYAEAELQAMIREQFVQAGGNSDQLVFANTRPHWNAFADVDLILDTFPTSSGTTVTEAAWMGVPTVTLQSRPIMGRAGAFVMRALGLE